MPADAYTFLLAWRWTQASHNVLPPEVMAKIVPIPEVVAPPGWELLEWGRRRQV